MDTKTAEGCCPVCGHRFSLWELVGIGNYFKGMYLYVTCSGCKNRAGAVPHSTSAKSLFRLWQCLFISVVAPLLYLDLVRGYFGSLWWAVRIAMLTFIMVWFTIVKAIMCRRFLFVQENGGGMGSAGNGSSLES